jgi:hypothetical protein
MMMGLMILWKIKYLDSYPTSTVLVFNRYEKFFKSNNYAIPWDGKLDGGVFQMDVLLYCYCK